MGAQEWELSLGGCVMEFKYQLGDRVAVGVVLDAVLREIATVLNHTSRLDTMRIVERISYECVGGTQLFYHCEAWDGTTKRYSEGSLVPAEEAWEQWVTAVNARDEKKEKP